MSEFEKANFITDRAIQDDPYPYFDWVREQGPVWRGPHFSMYMITGPPQGKGVLRRPGHIPGERPAVRDLLVLQCGQRIVRQVPGPDGRRRRQRPHREVPQR